MDRRRVTARSLVFVTAVVTAERTREATDRGTAEVMGNPTRESGPPVIEADLAALARTAVGLDIYARLAQQLRRIDPKKPAFFA